MHGGRADDGGVAHPARLRAALLRDRGRAARGRRRYRDRQDEPRRVRDGLVHRELGNRPDEESVGRDPHAGRQQRRFGVGGGRVHDPRGARIRHRRIDSPARRLLRARRPQAVVWPGVPIRPAGLCFVARSDRTPHQHCRRRGARAAGHRRARSTRLDLVCRGSSRLRRGRRSRRVGTPDRRPARPRRRGRGCEHPARVCRSARALARSRRVARRHRAASRPLRHPGVLPGRHRGSLVEPRPLRRRALRISRAGRGRARRRGSRSAADYVRANQGARVRAYIVRRSSRSWSADSLRVSGAARYPYRTPS